MAVKLQRLAIADYRQFRDVSFDFTDPQTGEPLRRVCLLGGNGTGKSTVLWTIWRFLTCANLQGPRTDVELSEGDTHWSRHVPANGILEAKEGEAVPYDPVDGRIAQTPAAICLPDSELPPASKNITDVPGTNLNEALRHSAERMTRWYVGQDNIDEFWTQLIALIKDREAGLLAFQRLPENKDRTIREVEADYLATHPDILKELADFWNVILERAGLEFDYENASLPIQLTDNLKAYIRLKNSGPRVAYADLSTGIRHFIFKLGHIFTLFRGHADRGGIVLVDEPENSLHPDFLFDLVSIYERAAPGAQLFMATHSPIIAAQFRPEERFILEFDDSRNVVVRRGVSPEGDDPNDLLVRDFAVRSIYGRKGLDQWRRFRELDRLIQHETDPAVRLNLMREYMEIGRDHNFDPKPSHEVPA
jgi:hypothetical protein